MAIMEMSKFRILYKAIIVILALNQSCITPSTDEIQKIDKPDYLKIKSFGIGETGQIIYQFYQKYGFTDLEEQLILITKPEKIDFLTSDLPLNLTDLQNLEKIDVRKFKRDTSIIYEVEKYIHSDMRLESEEFDSSKNKSVFHVKGKYKFVQTDSVETLWLFDKQTGLMYIESKK
ncbi:hypothetical protein V6R21_10260 [Limibacter armeniacum]|uniref:hypothetical protein n=1 Tax=Limibacter armeniacum TaxID=466084 RepID=UPI002FE51952